MELASGLSHGVLHLMPILPITIDKHKHLVYNVIINNKENNTMNNKNDDILDPNTIGTSQRLDTPKKVKRGPDFNRDFQRLINWIDRNILPYISLTLLSGLAYKGLSIYLPEMDDRATTVVAILGVSFLVVKLRSGRV